MALVTAAAVLVTAAVLFAGAAAALLLQLLVPAGCAGCVHCMLRQCVLQLYQFLLALFHLCQFTGPEGCPLFICRWL